MPFKDTPDALAWYGPVIVPGIVTPCYDKTQQVVMDTGLYAKFSIGIAYENPPIGIIITAGDNGNRKSEFLANLRGKLISDDGEQGSFCGQGVKPANVWFRLRLRRISGACVGIGVAGGCACLLLLGVAVDKVMHRKHNGPDDGVGGYFFDAGEEEHKNPAIVDAF